MAQNQLDHGAVPAESPLPSRRLQRLLGRHTKRAMAVDRAESNYHDVVLVESLRNGGTMRPASRKRIEGAFSALVAAVLDLQSTRAETMALADDEGVSPQRDAAEDESLRAADSTYAAYLAACTIDQVRAAAAHRRYRVG